MKELAGADDDGPSLLATIKAVPGCGLLMPTPRAGVLVGYGRVSTREQPHPHKSALTTAGRAGAVGPAPSSTGSR